MDDVAPRRKCAGHQILSVGETRSGAPGTGCRGLTQSGIRLGSMEGSAGNGKETAEIKTPRRFFPPGRRGCKACRRSGPAPPQAAVAPRHELQVVLVAGPLLVFRQLDLF